MAEAHIDMVAGFDLEEWCADPCAATHCGIVVALMVLLGIDEAETLGGLSQVALQAVGATTQLDQRCDPDATLRTAGEAIIRHLRRLTPGPPRRTAFEVLRDDEHDGRANA